MVASSPSRGFAGLAVAAFESRMAKEMTNLIKRNGGTPWVAQSMKEVPLEDNRQVLEFGDRLLAGKVEMVILLTGVGTRCMTAVWETRWERGPLLEALGQTCLVARGPKPVMALKELGLTPSIVVPEPNTWEDLIRSVDRFRSEGLKGVRVAVQEYGVSNPQLLEALQHRGAEVLPVPVYRWALPEDLSPLKLLLNEVLYGRIPVLLFTNAAQIDHIHLVLEQEGKVDDFRKCLTTVMVASIGQITSDRLRTYGWPVDLEPTHPKMGILVKEACQQVEEILKKKRTPFF